MKKKRRKKGTPRKYYKYTKPLSRTSRDFNSPHYKRWRDEIKQRDNYTCQWPGCLSRSRLEVHHIKTWAKYPSLRFVTANGITLCRKCHGQIKGKENDFETFFLKLLEWQMIEKIQKYNRKK